MTDDSAPTTAPSMLANVRRFLGVTQGQVVGDQQDDDPKPWDGPDGEPFSGAEGVMGSTFEPDLASTDWDTAPAAHAGPRHETPVPVRSEQPSFFTATSISATAVPTKALDNNPNRMRCEVYVKSSNVCLVAASAGAASSPSSSFPAEEGYPFLSDVTCELWITSPSVNQTVYVVEYWRSGVERVISDYVS